MSRSYRLSYLAIGRCLIVAFLVTPALADQPAKHSEPVPLSRPTDQSGKPNHGDYEQQSADASIEQAAVMRSQDETIAARIKDQRDERRADEDLNTQRRMADAAEEVVNLTRWQLWIAIAGTIAVVFNLVLARRANEAAVKSASAAMEGAKIARDSYVAEHRAWVKLEEVVLKHPTKIGEDGIQLTVETAIRNVGRSPAFSVKARVQETFNSEGAEKFSDREHIFKAGMRTAPLEIGTHLFSDEPMPLRQATSWFIGPDEFSGAIRTAEDGKKFIDLLMFVGVSYRVMGDDQIHLTHRAHGLLNFPVGYELEPHKRLPIPPMPFLPGEVD